MKKYYSIISIFSAFVFVPVAYAGMTASPTIASVAGDSYVNATEALAIHVVGTADAGATVTLAIADAAGHAATTSSTLYGSGFDLAINAIRAGFVDGTLSITVYSQSGTNSISAPVITSAVLMTRMPSLSLVGYNPMSCSIYFPCIDPGATAFDENGTPISVVVSGNLNPTHVDRYYLTYTATDAAGNSTALSRAIDVDRTHNNYSNGTPAATATTTASTTQTTAATTTPIASSTPPSTPVTTEPPIIVIKVSGIADTVKRQLMLGASGADVRLIQLVLSKDASMYPEGLITSYFGSLTRKAVGRFQEKYGIAKQGDAGYGQVGPRTKAKLIEVYGE